MPRGPDTNANDGLATRSVEVLEATDAIEGQKVVSVMDVPVRGMTCAACVRRVEKALGRVEGVTLADVNLITGQARISFDPSFSSHALFLDAVVNAIEKAGYESPRPDVDNVAPTTAPSPPSSARPAPDAAPTVDRFIDPSITVAAPINGKVNATSATLAKDLDDATEQHALARDLVIAAALGAPLFLLAMSHGLLAGANAVWARWTQLALATVVVVGPGRRFFVSAWRATIHATADMNTLVALGTGAAWIYSTVALVFPRAAPHLYFEASVAIIGFVLLGKLLEARARHHLSDAVRGLISLQPTIAHLLEAEPSDAPQGQGSTRRERDVAVTTLTLGQRIVVRPGERAPVDAIVVEGTSTVDESMLTGESLPVVRGPSSPLTAGTLNQTGALIAEVTATGKNSTLAKIVEAVEQAQGSKAPVARLADQISSYIVPVVLAIAAITFVVWMLASPSGTGLSTALERFVAVLVIACPCALGLATPAAVAAGTGRGAELGVLIKGGAALEAASHIDTVMIDKTGTLTTGHPVLSHVRRATPIEPNSPTSTTPIFLTDDHLLALVASAEQRSEHPIARSIVDAAHARQLVLSEPTAFRSEPGAGIEATLPEGVVLVGTERWLVDRGVHTNALSGFASDLASQGNTPVFVALESHLVGLVTVADPIAPEARSAVATLLAMGIEVIMLTGDREGTANAIAAELGILEVRAEARPVDKAAVVIEAKSRGRRVAMVGDGVNDAPALVAADLGIAMGTGSDIAASSADIVLLRGGIGSLPTALWLARHTLRTIRQNLFWAFVYNVIGVPIAAGVFYPWTGLLLSPVLASAAMSLSSVSVIANSLRLRRATPA